MDDLGEIDVNWGIITIKSLWCHNHNKRKNKKTDIKNKSTERNL